MNTLTRTLQLFVVLVVAAVLPLRAVAQDDIQYNRPAGQQGINVFEPPKQDTTKFDGFDVEIGGAFTQQLQAINHSNAAGTLPEIGRGFNLATANLDLDAQLARGIRVHVRTYLSSRHHNDAWVKGGYLQIDELPMVNSDGLDRLMDHVTIQAGHFMPNYGDTHFRRTDNADAIHNPFVGSYLLDAFTTEVGGRLTVRSNGFLAVGGFGGELDPTVAAPSQRAPSFYGKLGFDRQFTPMVRVRLTGSAYYTSSSLANHLHSGDRAGSRYYNVVGGGDHSGRIQSGFSDQVTAFMLNPFLKIGGLELFGVIESVSGTGPGLAEDLGKAEGSLSHYAGEAVYRFADEDLYVGLRYSTVDGALDHASYPYPQGHIWSSGNSASRWQLSAGWFMTENLLLKGEYVSQSYEGFPQGNARNGAEFSGLILEAIISF